jgi:biopolymer transport protein ExbD
MTAKSVRTICPECSAELLVNQQAIGRKMRCTQCDKVFIAEIAPEVSPVQAAPPPVVRASVPPPVTRWTTPVDRSSAEPVPPPVVSKPQPAAVLDEATPGVKKKSIRGFQEAEMDMTPMVDVTFQLLIFFMLTAAFTITQSQQFPKPEQTEPTTKPVPPEEDPDFIIVRIDENNTYFISGGDLGNEEEEAPSPQELMVKLGAARLGLSGKIPTKLLVKAHGDSTHERVVTAIDSGNDVGIEEVKVVTLEDEE